jgi:hypothetical protein
MPFGVATESEANRASFVSGSSRSHSEWATPGQHSSGHPTVLGKVRGGKHGVTWGMGLEHGIRTMDRDWNRGDDMGLEHGHTRVRNSGQERTSLLRITGC